MENAKGMRHVQSAAGLSRRFLRWGGGCDVHSPLTNVNVAGGLDAVFGAETCWEGPSASVSGQLAP